MNLSSKLEISISSLGRVVQCLATLRTSTSGEDVGSPLGSCPSIWIRAPIWGYRIYLRTTLLFTEGISDNMDRKA
jgi:hypothetical protein